MIIGASTRLASARSFDAGRPRLREAHGQGRADANRLELLRERALEKYAAGALRRIGAMPEIARRLFRTKKGHLPPLLLRVERCHTNYLVARVRSVADAALLREGV